MATWPHAGRMEGFWANSLSPWPYLASAYPPRWSTRAKASQIAFPPNTLDPKGGEGVFLHTKPFPPPLLSRPPFHVEGEQEEKKQCASTNRIKSMKIEVGRTAVDEKSTESDDPSASQGSGALKEIISKGRSGQ